MRRKKDEPTGRNFCNRQKLRISSNMRTPKAILIWEEAMPTLAGFGTFAALPEEQIKKSSAAAFSPVTKG